MKLKSKLIVFILLCTVSFAYSQDMLTFDDQGWSNNQELTSNQKIGDYTFSSSNKFYTNYGYNFNVNENSLYYVFKNPSSDKIIITTKNNSLVKFIKVDAYQVSESSTQSLIIEGWNASSKLHSKSFSNVKSWQTLSLNFNNINKVIIRLSSSSTTDLIDYNFDNFSFEVVPLPVELTSFNAMCKEDGINLNWQTATEVNNFGFDIERASVNSHQSSVSSEQSSVNWEKVGFVKGHGTSTIAMSYSFNDNSAINGVNYKYRLKQIDENGEYNYSNEIEVTADLIPVSFNLYQNYPNPFNPVTNIQYSVSGNQHVSIKIYDIAGHEITTLVNENKQPGKYEVQFNASSLSSGVYIYKLITDGFSSTKKMILLK